MGLTSRVSFEPLDELKTSSNVLSNPISRDSSGASADFEEREGYDNWRAQHPCLIRNFDQFAEAAQGKLVTVFLDYDGTLTPIVSNPDAAYMSTQMRDAVQQVAQLFPTGIISGRGRKKVEDFVGLSELYYAGSHGMDIIGPQTNGNAGEDMAFQPAAQYAPLMNEVHDTLVEELKSIPGSSVEHNKFCVSVHFRNCAPELYPQVQAVVETIAARYEQIRITRGRKVLELRPQVDWDKGTALVHLLDMLGLQKDDVYCVYIGDDRTDEDAFKVLSETGLGDGVLVSTRAKPTCSRWTLRHPEDVAAFLDRLIAWGADSETNRWFEKKECVGWQLCDISNSRTSLEAVTSPKSPSYAYRQQQAANNGCALPPLPPKSTNKSAENGGNHAVSAIVS